VRESPSHQPVSLSASSFIRASQSENSENFISPAETRAVSKVENTRKNNKESEKVRVPNIKGASILRAKKQKKPKKFPNILSDYRNTTKIFKIVQSQKFYPAAAGQENCIVQRWIEIEGTSGNTGKMPAFPGTLQFSPSIEPVFLRSCF